MRLSLFSAEVQATTSAAPGTRRRGVRQAWYEQRKDGRQTTTGVRTVQGTAGSGGAEEEGGHPPAADGTARGGGCPGEDQERVSGEREREREFNYTNALISVLFKINKVFFFLSGLILSQMDLLNRLSVARIGKYPMSLNE